MTQRQNNKDPRSAATVNSKLDKRLVAYIAAAGATGAGLIAPAAQAKVVYTPANTEISATSIDLNHDGIADFIITFHGLDHTDFLTVAPLVAGNSIRSNSKGDAAAGFFGVPVGPGEKFRSTSGGTYGWGVFMARAFEYSVTSFGGPWANAVNRYLGLKFVINGQTHYGWARLSVGDWLLGGKVVLTGYAYETTPNKNIIEGHTSGAEKAGNYAPADLLAPPSQPASLGLLARGADGLAIWRREDETVAQ
jgi:hypothetical protein